MWIHLKSHKGEIISNSLKKNWIVQWFGTSISNRPPFTEWYLLRNYASPDRYANAEIQRNYFFTKDQSVDNSIEWACPNGTGIGSVVNTI